MSIISLFATNVNSKVTNNFINFVTLSIFVETKGKSKTLLDLAADCTLVIEYVPCSE